MARIQQLIRTQQLSSIIFCTAILNLYNYIILSTQDIIFKCASNIYSFFNYVCISMAKFALELTLWLLYTKLMIVQPFVVCGLTYTFI